MGDFPKIKEQQKKSMLAAEALQMTILSRFSKGDKLPPERMLAQEMNISRATLREAIAALQLMGIIEVRQSQGHFVADLPKKTNAAFSLENIFVPNVDPLTMVDTRIGLEPGVAYLAAARATEKEIVSLEEHTDNIEKAILSGDQAGYAEADALFHLCIAKSSQNEIIAHIIGSLIDVRRGPLWQAMKEGLNSQQINAIRIQEHRTIFEAIKKRDSEAAELAMRRHLVSSKERFLHEVE